ncbi:hypothetical protein V8C44DRAFT_184129 [Trichoderma aethiopicum]
MRHSSTIRHTTLRGRFRRGTKTNHRRCCMGGHFAVCASILRGQRPVLAQGGYRLFDFRLIPISPLFIHAQLNQGTQHNRSHKAPLRTKHARYNTKDMRVNQLTRHEQLMDQHGPRCPTCGVYYFEVILRCGNGAQSLCCCLTLTPFCPCVFSAAAHGLPRSDICVYIRSQGRVS